MFSTVMLLFVVPITLVTIAGSLIKPRSRPDRVG